MGGKTFINDSVFIEIAKEAMRKVEEVYKQERKGGLAGFTRMFVDRFAPQITVKKTDPTNLKNQRGLYPLKLKLPWYMG